MLTRHDITQSAKAVTDLLSSAGLVCCLVGSAACAEHGITRTPNDVDVLVLTETKTPLEIKQFLVSSDSRFSLGIPESNPTATYLVLKYSATPSKSCHIDIFVPEMIHLPGIPDDRVVYSASGLPVMPFFPIILHKVQAWIAHRDSPKEHARVKQSNDVQDIRDLLDHAASEHNAHLKDQSWLPAWFLDEARQGVPQYIDAHPETVSFWEQIGFDARS